jgi:hypothetical protein
MTRLTVGVLVSLLLASSGACQSRRSPETLDPALRAELESHLAAHGKRPVGYVVGLFADHDVVLLGEIHRIQHDVRLVQALVRPLYEAGVRTLAIEFARREDQPLLDSLLAAPAWDEALARTIQFNQFVEWGFQEYVDIQHAAWELNRSLPADAPRFRILGLNDSPDWSPMQKPEDLDNGELKRQVWRGGGEQFWAKVVLDAVASGEKVLVYSGIHHAFTRYRQPVVVDGKFIRFDDALRMGNHVYNAIGERAALVVLHAPWCGPRGYDDEFVHPVDGVIDMLMFVRDEGPRTVAFDVDGPLASLPLGDCVYRYGYDDPRLADFCDGWIYTKPISLYEGVTPIPGWIHDANLERARAQTPNLRWRTYTVDQCNLSIARSADVPRRFRHLR